MQRSTGSRLFKNLSKGLVCLNTEKHWKRLEAPISGDGLQTSGEGLQSVAPSNSKSNRKLSLYTHLTLPTILRV
jgi:hypothetical protein